MSRPILALIAAALLAAGSPIEPRGSARADEKPCPLASRVPGGVCRLHGKVKFVHAFADYKIQIVDAFPDLKVQKVDAFPDKPGQWQVVDAFPDFTVQVVKAFPDFKVEYVSAFPGCH